MEQGVGRDLDVLAGQLPEITKDRPLFLFERTRDVRVDPQQEAVAVEIRADLPDFIEDLEADRGARLDDATRAEARAKLTAMEARLKEIEARLTPQLPPAIVRGRQR